MKKLIKRVVILACIIMLCTTSLSVFATESSSISIHYVPGACRFDFYKVCDFSEQIGFNLASPFSQYKEANAILEYINTANAEGLRNLTATMKAIILRDNIPCSLSASTNEKGDLHLPLQEPGVYIVLGEQTKDEEYVYTPAPVFISVPNKNENGEFNYNVSIDLSKYDKESVKETYTDYKVMKIWENDEHYTKRPVSVTVTLMQDGKAYDVVVLSVKNNWKYEWKNLEAYHDWTAVEQRVPDGYVMTVENEKDGSVIKNTYQNPPPPPDEELPQTGQLCWPVPMLMILGVVIFVLGRVLKNRQGLILYALGILVLTVAFGFMLYNIRDDKRASDMSDTIVTEIVPMIEEQEETEEKKTTYIEHPDMEMPTIMIDGNRYIGYLEIEDLGLVLPIADDCTQVQLKNTPCSYKGSIYQYNMVIAGHNYARHFSKLRRLDVGSPIKFTDAEGNVFQYKVGWSEIVLPTDLDKMTDNKGWDLTLFTCTYGGEKRYALRCILENK